MENLPMYSIVYIYLFVYTIHKKHVLINELLCIS